MGIRLTERGLRRAGFRAALVIGVPVLVYAVAIRYAQPQLLWGLGDAAWMWPVLLAWFGGRWVLDAVRWPRKRKLPPARSLRTRRLRLRRARAEDAAPLHAILSDAETLRHWDFPPHRSIDDTRTWLATYLSPKEPELCDHFVIERRGAIIGVLGARKLPWVGFVLAREQWGKGYGREALDAFVDYSFDRGATVLYAVTDAQNAACMALLRSAEFLEYERAAGTHAARDNLSFEAVIFQLAYDGKLHRPECAAADAAAAG